VEGHVFVSGLLVIETGILKDDAEALSRLLLVGARIEAIQLDTSAGGVKEGREHFDGCGLARAVRSQEGEDLALGYFKGDIADGGEISEGLYQVLNRNHASLEGLHNDTERYRFNCQDGMVRTMAFPNASRSLTKDGWAPYPGFPVKFVGVDEPHAAFLNESRTRGRCLVPRTGNPGISLVFGEIWDTTEVDR
jgi:hypothetical protein